MQISSSHNISFQSADSNRFADKSQLCSFMSTIYFFEIIKYVIIPVMNDMTMFGIKSL
jgi:hypothetical protein